MNDLKSRGSCYSLLKALTVPLVILGHLCVMYTADGAFHPVCGSRLLSFLSSYLYSFHMPAFFAVSGCIYGYGLQQGKYRRPLGFLAKKSRRLLVPYLIFGLLTVVPIVSALGLDSQSIPQAWLCNILAAGAPRHLWFLVVLFEIFVFAALIRPVTEKYPWFSFLLVFVLYWPLQRFLPSSVFGVSGFLQLRNFPRNLVFFFFGVLLDSIYVPFSRVTKKLWFLWILFPAVQFVYLLPGVANDTTRLFFGLLGIVGLLTLSVLGEAALPRLSERKWYRSFCGCGYGIFLLHPMMIYVIFYFAAPTSVSPYLLTAVSFVVVTAVCWGLTELYRQVRRKLPF